MDRTETEDDCAWCRLATTGPHVYEAEAFVVVLPESTGCPGGSLTVVPREHVQVVGQLRPRAMAAVLAELSQLAGTVRRTSGAREVEIRAHPSGDAGPAPSGCEHPTHLHFHVAAVPPGTGRGGSGPSVRRASPGGRRRSRR